MYRSVIKVLQRHAPRSAATFGDAASRREKSAYLAWMILLVGLGASVVMFQLTCAVLEREARQRFEVVVAESAGLVQKRIDSYNAVLYGARGLFNARGKVTRREFHEYFSSLDPGKRYPGMVSLNFARNVLHELRPAFEQEIRADNSLHSGGYPNYRIFPPGSEVDYLALEFIEPSRESAAIALLGGDVRRLGEHPSDAAHAMDTARDLNRLATSGRLFRIPGTSDKGLYVVRLPVYRPGAPLDTIEQRRAAYFGSLGHAFALDEMLRAILPEATLRHLRIQLHDAGWSNAVADIQPSASNLLFDSDKSLGGQASGGAGGFARVTSPRFTQSAHVDMAGRKWLLHFSDYSEPHPSERIFSWGTFAGGVLVSLLLYWLVRSVTGSRQRALRAVAGIMHDINQPLTAVTVLSSNAEKLLQKGRLHDVRNNLGLIVEMAERMGRIVGQLRSFARDDDDVLLEAVAVREAVGNAVLLVETQARNLGIDVRVHDCDVDVRAVADAVRLEQVLLNLLRNAIDATDSAEHKAIEVRAEAEGARVVVSVTDSGPGIGPEAMEHLFEPFYTTKPVGKGLGLGLAISLATVRRFGGELRVQNVPEGGARFELILNRAEK